MSTYQRRKASFSLASLINTGISLEFSAFYFTHVCKKNQISLCCLYYRICSKEDDKLDFLGSPVVKNPPANAGDMGLIPGLGRFHMPQCN